MNYIPGDLYGRKVAEYFRNCSQRIAAKYSKSNFAQHLVHSQPFSIVSHMEPTKDETKPPTLRIENIYPHAFWLEKFTKENQFQSTLFENYLPNTAKSKGFTPKFYSKYCEIDMTNKDYQKFIKLIESSYQNRNRTGLPVCQNQEYGWIWEPFTNLDAKERQRLIRSRCRGELSEFAEKLEEQKITDRPKFGGLTFKV